MNDPQLEQTAKNLEKEIARLEGNSMTAQAGIKQAELDAVRAQIETLRKATGTCDYKMDDGQLCGKPTNQVFSHGLRQYWFCDDHLREGAERIIGRPFRA